jgi:UDP-3-O-[3-hydroxymyristoyl] glucosamine N-acyltransferase LpxD
MSSKGINAKDIASLVNGVLVGPDVSLDRVVAVSDLGPRALSFVRKYSDELLEKVNSESEGVVICPEEYMGKLKTTHILVENPRLAFLRAMSEYFIAELKVGISNTAIIHDTASLGKGVYVGEGAYIGPDVVMGDNCVIHHNVVITNGTIMGDNCTVKSNSVIGEAGFGFEYSEFGRPEHFPHIGKVVIGNNVWIGSCSTIERAALDETHVADNVKIDDKVQVGHNCVVGEDTLLMAGVVLCGGCRIGSGCWIAPNTVIKEKIVVNDNVYTGLASVVINDVEKNVVIVGNPAKILRSR